MTTHYSVCVERCCPLESIRGFFWLQMWINYINVPLESVYVETIQDVSKYIHLFHRSSDLLTYLKFQYSKVTHVTISFIEVVLISFQYLLATVFQWMFEKNANGLWIISSKYSFPVFSDSESISLLHVTIYRARRAL